MSTAKQIKQRLRAHVNSRLNDLREIGRDDICSKMYGHYAYGAIWAASYAEAITEVECRALLDEINGRTPLGTCPAL